MGFVERLRRVLRVPVVTRTSGSPRGAGERWPRRVKRKDRAARLDQAAAALILQEVLDERRRSPCSAGEPVRKSPTRPARRPRGAGRGASSSRSPRSSAWPAPPGRRGGTKRGRRRSRGRAAGEARVPPGSSADAIARQLQGLGLVRHPLVFRALARAREWARSSRPGSTRSRAALARGDPRRSRPGRRRATATSPYGGRSLDDVALLVVGRAWTSRTSSPPPRSRAGRDLDPGPPTSRLLLPDTYDLPQVPRRRGPSSPDGQRSARSSLRAPRIAERDLTCGGVTSPRSSSRDRRAEERPRIAARVLNRLEKE